MVVSYVSGSDSTGSQTRAFSLHGSGGITVLSSLSAFLQMEIPSSPHGSACGWVMFPDVALLRTVFLETVTADTTVTMFSASTYARVRYHYPTTVVKAPFKRTIIPISQS